MMKRMAVLALIPALGLTQELPLIVGTIRNRDKANITFTTYQGDCKDSDHMVYTQSEGGKVALTGCYRIVGNQLFVLWDDGDVYTYPWENLVLSDEMLQYRQKSR